MFSRGCGALEKVPGARARNMAQLVKCFLYRNVSVFCFFALELSLKKKKNLSIFPFLRAVSLPSQSPHTP